MCPFVVQASQYLRNTYILKLEVVRVCYWAGGVVHQRPRASAGGAVLRQAVSVSMPRSGVRCAPLLRQQSCMYVLYVCSLWLHVRVYIIVYVCMYVYYVCKYMYVFYLNVFHSSMTVCVYDVCMYVCMYVYIFSNKIKVYVCIICMYVM